MNLQCHLDQKFMNPLICTGKIPVAKGRIIPGAGRQIQGTKGPPFFLLEVSVLVPEKTGLECI